MSVIQIDNIFCRGDLYLLPLADSIQKKPWIFKCIIYIFHVSVEIATLTRENGKTVIRVLKQKEVEVLIKKHEEEEAKAEREKKDKEQKEKDK